MEYLILILGILVGAAAIVSILFSFAKRAEVVAYQEEIKKSMK